MQSACPGLHANAKIAILAKNRKNRKHRKSVAFFAILTIFAKIAKIAIDFQIRCIIRVLLVKNEAYIHVSQCLSSLFIFTD